MTAKKILSIAQKELGTKESPANSNKVKYNTAYYGKEVSGSSYPWCATFVWWVFREAGASSLFYGGKKTAYCPTLMTYHRKQAVSSNYQPGDVIFFNFSGKSSAAHVGICESWDGQYITTIDGNTGSGNEANGGAVMRRKRAKKYIVGAYRPAYRKEEVEVTEEQVKKLIQNEISKLPISLTYEQWRDYMLRYRAELSELPASDWAKTELEMARAAEITDGTRPQDFSTRQEVSSMILRMIRKYIKFD